MISICVSVLTYLLVLLGLALILWAMMWLTIRLENRLKESPVLSGLPHYKTDLTVLLRVADDAFSEPGSPAVAQACVRVALAHGIPIALYENLLDASGLEPDAYTHQP